MSIEYCDKHGHYDTDFTEVCKGCERDELAALEADRQHDEGKLRDADYHLKKGDL